MLLTRSLGYKSLEALGEMSSYEYCFWVAEFERSPWDEDRADLRAAIIASTIANFAGKTRKDGVGPASPLDYMPYSKVEQEEIIPDFNYLKDYVSKANAG